MNDQVNYDVIVVGGGGAGMTAALHAANEGASVALIEADQKLGGSTALSGGVYYAAGTSVQRERGITNDTPDAMFEYYMTLNQYRVEASLARTLCDHAGTKLEWLKELGVNFPAESLYSSGVESIPRGHTAHGRGAEIAEVLDREVSNSKVDVVLGSRLQELVINADGRVTGVRVGDDIITSHNVILATGGFGANPYYLSQYYPDAAEQHDKAWYIGSSHCQGDGLLLGQEAGADIVGHNRGLLLTTPDFKKELEVFVPGWLTYVNREGRRFINEMAEYAVMSGVIKAQTGGSCFAIFDDEARRTAKPNKQYEDAFAAGIISLNWISDEIDAQIKTGKVMQADTLEGLETKCGIRPGSLAATFDKYNKDIKFGEDSMFFKDHSEMKPMATAPFYAVEILPAIICLTSTGLRINNQAQVLDTRDQPIEGLFAAGETTGNVLGERYIGGGNSITNAIVFGAIAGVEAAKEAARKG